LGLKAGGIDGEISMTMETKASVELMRAEPTTLRIFAQKAGSGIIVWNATRTV